MLDNFLNVLVWNTKTTESFIKALNSYPNERKCEIIYKFVPNLFERANDNTIEAAETILIWATQNILDVESTHYKSLIYFRLGQLYENYREDYERAYTYYKSFELNNVSFEGVHSILLRSVLYRDNFVYSEEMENELKLSYGEYDLGLRQDRLYENIGSLLVAQKNNDEETAEMHKKRIKAIIKAEEYFLVDLVFKKDTIPDILKTPDALLKYLKTI